MNRKNPTALHILEDEKLDAVAGGTLATCGKLGTLQMTYYDLKDSPVKSFVGGFLKGAGCAVPTHHT